jgi:hypothetical protein
MLSGVAAAVPAAQRPQDQPPGPYVIDLRGATVGLPQDVGFYPPLSESTLVPARGFGADAGAHVYLLSMGPGRLGAGGSFTQVRGTNGVVASGQSALTLRLFTPQLSINFGSAAGWSYISAGAGLASLSGRFRSDVLVEQPGERTRTLLAFNVGGGARWFFTRRLAVGFDLRLYRIGSEGATVNEPGAPSALLGGAAVGLSVK